MAQRLLAGKVPGDLGAGLGVDQRPGALRGRLHPRTGLTHIHSGPCPSQGFAGLRPQFQHDGVCVRIAERDGFFVGRQHRTNLPVKVVSKLVKCGETETGRFTSSACKPPIQNTGETMLLRRIEVRLFEKTRDGDVIIGLFTNLPDTVDAVAIAEIYRKRWTIETQFQFLTGSLHCEVPGLGKPKAALFAFAMSLVASNALAVVRGSIRAVTAKRPRRKCQDTIWRTRSEPSIGR